ncbi:LLM class flavin-dependent oxidoreductase [uncultured Jatrophihabitans sp.]|uniref:LLM class flavin-dependent oxidoreductase n=1 Tax=uncultured Jatrophihabitans sp. TaxID=1610747 RepID=UPI0035CC7D4B
MTPQPDRVTSNGLRPPTLGFITRVSFTSDAGPAAGLRDGIELFRFAEDLGIQRGWAYQRHFDSYLSAPLPFFAAVGQHTSRITLGSAVIPLRYQEPVLFAEAAATTDLLVGERLQLAVSSGGNAWDAVFGLGPTGLTGRAEGQRRLAKFLAAIDGDVLHTVDEELLGAPPVGTHLRATPYSPTLRSRMWYGSGHVGSAVLAAQQGLRLITAAQTEPTEETFAHYQARLISEYRRTYRDVHDRDAPPVAVPAFLLPGTTEDDLARYEAYDLDRQQNGPASSRPQGALIPSANPALAGVRFPPVIRGTPEEVTKAVIDDVGLQAADELILFLPPGFGPAQNKQILRDVVAHVAPNLGWAPTG